MGELCLYKCQYGTENAFSQIGLGLGTQHPTDEQRKPLPSLSQTDSCFDLRNTLSYSYANYKGCVCKNTDVLIPHSTTLIFYCPLSLRTQVLSMDWSCIILYLVTAVTVKCIPIIRLGEKPEAEVTV